MHVDLTLEEMRHILEVVGAGDNTKPLVTGIIGKLTALVAQQSRTDAPQPEPGVHPSVGAQQWKAPL